MLYGRPSGIDYYLRTIIVHSTETFSGNCYKHSNLPKPPINLLIRLAPAKV